MNARCEILDDIPASPYKKRRVEAVSTPTEVQLIVGSPARKKRSLVQDYTPNAKPSRSSAAF